MSSQKPTQAARKPISRNIPPKGSVEKPGTNKAAGFAIPYPLLLLSIITLLLYSVSTNFGLTELDDSIFIKDFHEYNEDVGNLTRSFERGLFDPVKDPYYRPLFMDSMILNYQLNAHVTDDPKNFVSYHIINILFHIICVLLLYQLLRKLSLKDTTAFILTLLFAVHPVLSQAVSWIPGRNDTMLAIFILSFFLCAIDYADKGKAPTLLLSALFLLLAYFTKETAVFAAPAAFVLLVFVLQHKWNDKILLVQYAIWAACFLIWFGERAQATIKTGIEFKQVLLEFIPRLPVIAQYLGKIFFPFNLSVFPTQRDTEPLFGIAAILFLGAIIFLSKQKNYRIIFSGLAVFILFLLPALLVPSSLNEQTFEHRLYLPIIGILLILPQTILFNNKLSGKQLTITGTVVAAVFAIVNFVHQGAFADPVTFWQSAAETSPHSAYANMMLGARLKDEQESYKLFHKAYQLNPNEKYINYYYGVMLQKQDSVLASKKYLLTEKKNSGYYECDFYLARVAMTENKPDSAIYYLETYLKSDPANSQANNNLLLLYLNTKQPEKEKARIEEMRKSGIPVPKGF